MKAKHTPGPWTIFNPKRKGATFGIDGADGSAVCFYGESEIEGIPRRIDAKLIAAAPDLLEALQTLLEVWPNKEKKPGWTNRWAAAQAQGHAAIAKATGEQE